MDSIVDLAESRKAKTEKSEQFRHASKDLLILLERQRVSISQEYMTFLLAMALSDQALYYATVAGQKKAGSDFIENLFNTTQLLYDAHFPGPVRTENTKVKAEGPSGQVLPFVAETDHA
jgi:hypothetical protein